MAYIIIGRTVNVLLFKPKLSLFKPISWTMVITFYYLSVKLLTSTTNFQTKRSYHYWVVVIYISSFLFVCYGICDRFRQALWLVYWVCSSCILIKLFWSFDFSGMYYRNTNLTFIIIRIGGLIIYHCCSYESVHPSLEMYRCIIAIKPSWYSCSRRFIVVTGNKTNKIINSNTYDGSSVSELYQYVIVKKSSFWKSYSKFSYHLFIKWLSLTLLLYTPPYIKNGSVYTVLFKYIYIYIYMTKTKALSGLYDIIILILFLDFSICIYILLHHQCHFCIHQ